MNKASHDASVAAHIVASDGPELDVAAFHCQQAIEKMLKAFLVHHRVEFEKIHDLRRLLDLCAGVDATFDELRDSVEPLTVYAVAYRYPGPADPTADEVSDACNIVQHVEKFISARLEQ